MPRQCFAGRVGRGATGCCRRRCAAAVAAGLGFEGAGPLPDASCAAGAAAAAGFHLGPLRVGLPCFHGRRAYCRSLLLGDGRQADMRAGTLVISRRDRAITTRSNIGRPAPFLRISSTSTSVRGGRILLVNSIVVVPRPIVRNPTRPVAVHVGEMNVNRVIPIGMTVTGVNLEPRIEADALYRWTVSKSP